MSMCSADVTKFFFRRNDETVQHSVSFFSDVFVVCIGIKEAFAIGNVSILVFIVK